MKAQSLSICIPTDGKCNKNCPYCISKMTGNTRENEAFMSIRSDIVKSFAKRNGINSVILTGKGEPLLNMDSVIRWLRVFEEYPTEVQTNGLTLDEDTRLKLGCEGANTIAISIDWEAQFNLHKETFRDFSKMGLITRATVCLTNEKDFPRVNTLGEFIKAAKSHYIRQLSFREVTIPNFGCVDTPKSKKAQEWIREYIDRGFYNRINLEILERIQSRTAYVIRSLPYGAKVVDIDGISVTAFPYCIQDTSEDNIRSLIFRADGHLYTSWNSDAGILF